MLGSTLILVNPAARSGKASEVAAQTASVLDQLKAHSPQELTSYSFHYTIAPHDATPFIQQEGAQYDTIIAVGGDGIVNEVINGLMAIPAANRPRFGLIPCGNGDDFARSIHMDRNPTQSLQQFATRTLTPKRIDVGRANTQWFAETLSFGLDAAIALGTQELRNKTKRTGTSLYVQCGIDQLRNHRDIHEVTMTLDGGAPQSIACYMLAIQNGMSYGGGFKVCPQARLNDGLLDICYATPPLSFMAATTLFLKAKDGKHIHDQHIHFETAKRIELSFKHALPSQIDGEKFDDTEVVIETFPGELEVLMP